MGREVFLPVMELVSRASVLSWGSAGGALTPPSSRIGHRSCGDWGSGASVSRSRHRGLWLHLLVPGGGTPSSSLAVQGLPDILA